MRQMRFMAGRSNEVDVRQLTCAAHSGAMPTTVRGLTNVMADSYTVSAHFHTAYTLLTC